MIGRVLIKVSADRYCIRFRVINPDLKPHQSFSIFRDNFKALEDSSEVIARDGASFAVLRKNAYADTVSIQFTWLSCSCGGQLMGWEQTVKLPFEGLRDFVKESAGENGPSEWAVLSIVPRERPQFVFHGKENLHAALENKTVRRKLVRVLRDNFQWKGTDEICFYNDFSPYSFTFREFKSGYPGMCGGLILHGQEDLAKAYYSIHT